MVEHGRGFVERLGLEAGPPSPWLCEGKAAGLPAICIETRRIKGATAIMAVQTDRSASRAIAHAMRVVWFTAVQVKTAESQGLRLLLTNRKTLQTSRVMLENQIRGTLACPGRSDWAQFFPTQRRLAPRPVQRQPRPVNARSAL